MRIMIFPYNSNTILILKPIIINSLIFTDTDFLTNANFNFVEGGLLSPIPNSSGPSKGLDIGLVEVFILVNFH